MTTSMTRANTFTITDARVVASKLGADLRNLNTRYGRPDLTVIPDYVEETAQYLKAAFLDTVDFGFKDGDSWVLRLRYRATAGGYLEDSVPGSLPGEMTVAGCPFHSFLITSAAYALATQAQRDALQAVLPFPRTAGVEPTANHGSTGYATSYSRNGIGLGREVYVAH